jgi:iron complex transport system substrate-binding protein
MARIEAETAAIATRPTIACIEWIDPLMAGGNWMPELVAMAGGTNLFGTAGAHSPWMTWDDLRRADPEVIAVLPCGFDIERTRREMPALTADSLEILAELLHPERFDFGHRGTGWVNL